MVQPAVHESLKTGKPLFVFLSEEGEQSTTFVDRLLPLEGDILDKVEACFIAVKLIENTVDYGFFQQIFPDISTPSFYIVSQGQVLDIIQKDTSLEEFKTRMAKYTPQGQGQLQANQQSNVSTNINNSSRNTLENSNSSNRDLLRKSTDSEPQLKRQQGSSHEENVRKRQAEVKALKKQQQQEKDRLRALINADKKERLSQQKELEKIVDQEVKPKPIPANSFKNCSLAIKLFDGSSIVHDFSADQTLNDVRSWLETQIEIIPDVSSLPSFASHTGPNHYVFHRPTIPRATFTNEQEFIKLSELDLCPRSALILKPIFTEVTSAYPKEKGSIFKSIYEGASRFIGALYSFFDYGVDQVHEEQNDTNEVLLTEGISSGIDTNRIPLRETNSGTTTPSLLSISDNNVSRPSLINIEDFRSNSTHRIPQSPVLVPQVIDANNGTPLISRVGTPIRRLQTVHRLDDDEDKLNGYNGNGVNLNPNKKDENNE